MNKWTYIFVIILSMFLIYTIPTYGEPFLKLDEWDPVDDPYILTPGLAFNVDSNISPLSFLGELDCTWTFNNNSGLQGAFLFTDQKYKYSYYDYYFHHSDFYIGITYFWKKGPFYMEIGPVLDTYHASIIHTGLNGFFPLIGPSGLAFENNFNICLDPDLPFNGLVKGGWMWLFGKNSHLLIGGCLEYGLGYGGTFEPHLGLVELSLDDKIGHFLFDGKVQLDLLNGDGVDANISAVFMPISWVGIGVNFTTSSIGGTLKVRI